MSELIKLFEQRAKDFSQQAAYFQERYNRLSFVRLALFLGAAAFMFYLFGTHIGLAFGFIFLFILFFYRFMLWHQSFADNAKHNLVLKGINENEARAASHDFQAFGDGTNYQNSSHPNSYDLDMFGPHSFFQYTNRCASALGRQRLAEYLNEIVKPELIQKRQQAITELMPLLDWRQNFQAQGQNTADELKHLEWLQRWLETPNPIKNHRFFWILAWVMPAWIGLGLFLYLFYIPWQAAILFLIPPALILQRTTIKVNQIHNYTSAAAEILSTYSKLIQHIEDHKFEAELLKDIQSKFIGSKLASKEIKQLAYQISQLNVRYNAFAIILNIIMLWDIRWTYRLEQWKLRQQDRLPSWFDSLKEMEALQSFAATYYLNKDWTFPQLSLEPELEAEEIGHPLIDPRIRITNDLSMPTQGHIKLITGSNMAGKSTFLRTIGLNIVLAMAGAPVCAKKLKLPWVQVYSSMRTTDALSESTSSFYAELKRLKFIIEAVEHRKDQKTGPHIFFLLDEILKGTNSNDRHTGSRALINQLIEFEGAGLIATHDLDLGKMESEVDGTIENWRMEVEIENGELAFDYKLKRGITQSFNASILMRNMGILIPEE